MVCMPLQKHESGSHRPCDRVLSVPWQQSTLADLFGDWKLVLEVVDVDRVTGMLHNAYSCQLRHLVLASIGAHAVPCVRVTRGM